MKRFAVILLKLSCTTLLAAALLMASLLLFIRTEKGKAFVISVAESFLRKNGAEEARIGPINGDFPWAFSLDQLFLRWPAGGVDASNITLKWRPLRLLSGVVHFDELAVRRAEIIKGTGRQIEKSTSSVHPHLFLSILRHLKLQRMHISSLILPKSFHQIEEEFSLVLQTSSSGEGGGTSHFLLESVGTQGTLIKTRLSFLEKGMFLELSVAVSDGPGGPLSKAIGAEGPVRILFEGRGPMNDWQGEGLLEGITQISDDGIQAAFSFGFTPEKAVFEIRRLVLKSKNMELILSGEISLDDLGFIVNYGFRGIEPLPLKDLHIKGGIEANGRLSGNFEEIILTGIVSAVDLAFNEVNAQAMRLDYKLNLITMRGSCRGTIRDLRSDSLPELNRASVQLKMDEISFQRGKISFSGVHIKADSVTMTLSGEYLPGENQISSRGNIAVEKLSRIPFPHSDKLPYRSEIDFNIQFNGTKGAMQGSIYGNAEQLEGPTAFHMPGFLEADKITFKVIFALEDRKRLLIRHAEILTPAISVTGSGLMEDRFVEVNWGVRVPEVANFRPISSPFLAGPLEAEGNLLGRYPSITATAHLRTKEIRADVKFKTTPTGLGGNLVIQAGHKGNDVILRTYFDAESRAIHLKDFLLEVCGTTLSGRIDLDLDSFTAAGTIHGRSDDISCLSAFLPIDAKGKCSLDAVLKGSNKGQGIEARLRMEDIDIKGLTSPRLDIAFVVDDALRKPVVRASASSKSLLYGGISGLGMELSFIWDGQVGTATVKKGALKYGDIEAALLSPMELRVGTDFFSLGNTSLQVTLPLAQEIKHIPISLDMNASGGRGSLRLRAFLEDRGKDPLEAVIEAPLRFSMNPFALLIPETGELGGYLTAEMELAVLRPFLQMLEQEVAGRLSCFISIGGRPESPAFFGRIDLTDGLYSYPRWGISIRQIKAEAHLSGRALEITSLYASDGKEGVIRGSGRAGPISLGRPDAHLDLVLEGFKAVNLDEARVTAAGRISALLDSSGLSLSGRLSGGPVELMIPRRGFQTIEEIEVLEIPPPNIPGQGPLERPRSVSSLDIRLDLGLEIPGRMFLRGRGLESEWEGKLSLFGYASEPHVNGLFKAVRGRFNLLGKTFDLKEGVVRLEGASASSAYINASAQTRSAGIIALVRISGTLANPLIELSSDPPIPQDEILSKVLFGRDLSRITPLQALSLAEAALALRGGGGLDLTGRARRLLGVDDIEIKLSEKGANPAVGVGKYLGEKLFIRLESGADPESSKASAQMELTPNILLESEVGADAKGEIGIKWRWDY